MHGEQEESVRIQDKPCSLSRSSKPLVIARARGSFGRVITSHSSLVSCKYPRIPFTKSASGSAANIPLSGVWPFTMSSSFLTGNLLKRPRVNINGIAPPRRPPSRVVSTHNSIPFPKASHQQRSHSWVRLTQLWLLRAKRSFHSSSIEKKSRKLFSFSTRIRKNPKEPVSVYVFDGWSK